MATNITEDTKAEATTNAMNAIASERGRIAKANEGLFVKCEKATVSGGYAVNPFIVSAARLRKETDIAKANGRDLDARFRLMTDAESRTVQDWKRLNTLWQVQEESASYTFKALEKAMAKASNAK